MTVALFVPGDRPERFEKAAASGADAVIVDLEDGVAGARKAAARDAVRAALAEGRRYWVRVNPARSADGAADAAVLADAPPEAVMLAKTAGADDVAALRERLPGVALVALVESVEGLGRIAEIASSGVVALAFGAYDLCAELGARPTAAVVGPLRSQVVFAARRAGIRALDTPFAGLDDEAALAADARAAADFGFDGKLAVHPKQIAVIRAAFVPDAAEVERARAIIAAAAGGGAVRFGGDMIDAPLVAAAQRTVARARERNAHA